MSVRWNDNQFKAMENYLEVIEHCRLRMDKASTWVLDMFNDTPPKDLIQASSQMHEGITKIRMLVDFQRMIREEK